MQQIKMHYRYVEKTVHAWSGAGLVQLVAPWTLGRVVPCLSHLKIVVCCDLSKSYLSHDVRKPVFGGFRPGPTQTGLYSHRRWLEAWNFELRKQRDCTIQVAKTKALISFAVTSKLICVFVFAYAKIRFSHVAAHFMAQNIYLFLVAIKSSTEFMIILFINESDLVIVIAWICLKTLKLA